MANEVMQDKCSTCAFRSGTRANKSALTLIKARLCAEIQQEFYCHENAVFVTESGRTIKCQDRNRIDVLTREHPKGSYFPGGGDWKLCAGWAALYEKLKADNYFANEPEWRTRVKKQLLELIEKAESEGAEWDEARCQQEVAAIIELQG